MMVLKLYIWFVPAIYPKYSVSLKKFILQMGISTVAGVLEPNSQ
jgi:hypothetical protein